MQLVWVLLGSTKKSDCAEEQTEAIAEEEGVVYITEQGEEGKRDPPRLVVESGEAASPAEERCSAMEPTGHVALPGAS